MYRATCLFALLLMSSAPVLAEERPEPLPEGAKVRLGSTRFRFGAPITHVTLSPDGKQIAAAAQEGIIRLWDAGTGQTTAECDGSLGPVEHFTYSPDGKSLAAVSFTRGVRVHDTATGKLRWSVQQADGDYCAAWSPNGQVLAAGGHDGVIRLIGSADGKLVRSIAPNQGAIHAVHFTPDGKQLLSLGADRQLRRWDAATGEPLRQRALGGLHPGPPLPPRILGGRRIVPRVPPRIAFSADAKSFAVSLSNGMVNLWNLEGGMEPREMGSKIHGDPRTPRGGQPAISPDGRFLLVSSTDSLSLWGITSGKEIRRLNEPGQSPGTAAFSQDGRTFASARGSFIELWDTRSWKRNNSDGLPETGVRGLAFLNGGTLVSLHERGDLCAWDLAKGSLASTHPERCRFQAGLAALPGGKAVRSFAYTTPGWLDWEPGGASKLRRGQGTVVIPLSPDGRTYARNEDATVLLCDADTYETMHKFSRGPFRSYLFFTEDGKRFATRAADGGVHVWDVTSGQSSPAMTGTENTANWFLPPGGQMVIHVGAQVRVWETATGRERSRFTLNRQATMAAFTPDARTLVVGTVQGEVVGLDLDTGKEIVRRSGHRGAVRCLRFSPDGQLLGSGGDDTAVIVWDAAAFRVPRPAEQKLGERAAKMWDELTAEDAGRAFQAIQALSNSGAEAVAFIRGNLRPMKEKLGERINSLLVQLDARSFAKRDAAMRQLTEIGPEAAPELEKLLNGKPTLDLKNRVEELLKRSQMAPVGDRLRGVRAVEVLSRISTPAARQALTELADGAPDAWLTREARAAMERLGK